MNSLWLLFICIIRAYHKNPRHQRFILICKSFFKK